MFLAELFESGYLPDGRRNPWMWGKCYDFALALSEKIPDAEFVAIGMSPMGAEHVGLRKSNKYYDCRGELTAEQFADGKTDDINDIEIVSREDVELHAGVAGMKPPYKGNKDIAMARKAVKAIFGNRP
jgi:hypothetical protein